MTYTIDHLPVQDRPRERLRRLGASALSQEELLAILLGSGSKKEPVLKLARELIIRFKTLKNLSEATLEEMMRVPGIGEAKALKLKAAFSLALRSQDKCEKILKISKPLDVFEVIKPFILGEKREIFFLLLLNVRGELLSLESISTGILNATIVHPREVFLMAIRKSAHAVIAVHNHPSGDVTPSQEDILITDRLVKAGELLGISLFDHVIVSENSFISLRERGIVVPTQNGFSHGTHSYTSFKSLSSKCPT